MTPEHDRTPAAHADLDERLRTVEAAVESLRAAVGTLEREVALIHADIERLRPETERAVAPKVP